MLALDAKVAELVDAQDSGSCKRKLVGVQVPPFALPSFLVITSFLLMLGCRSRADRMLDRTIENLQVAANILQKNAGNTDAAVHALDKYIKAHEKQLIRLHANGMDMFRAMSPEQRKEFSKKALKRSMPIKTRIDNLLKTYPNPQKIVIRLHRLM